MDNLFAVIVPDEDFNKTSTLITNQLSKVTFNRVNSASINILDQINAVYLVNYSSQLIPADNTSQFTDQKTTLTQPIIGNNRVDNKNSIMDLCGISNFSSDIDVDSQALLAAYKKWGTESFSNIKGQFSNYFLG